MLGAGTVLGRPLTPDDDRLGSPNEVVVLSLQSLENPLRDGALGAEPDDEAQRAHHDHRGSGPARIQRRGGWRIGRRVRADHAAAPAYADVRRTNPTAALLVEHFCAPETGKDADNDVAAINASSLSVVKYFPHLGTVNLGLAVNPQSGNLYVANTDALNLVMFENNLNGHIVNHRITFVDPSTGQTQIWDLNPGINYSQLPNPAALATFPLKIQKATLAAKHAS